MGTGFALIRSEFVKGLRWVRGLSEKAFSGPFGVSAFHYFSRSGSREKETNCRVPAGGGSRPPPEGVRGVFVWVCRQRSIGFPWALGACPFAPAAARLRPADLSGAGAGSPARDFAESVGNGGILVPVPLPPSLLAWFRFNGILRVYCLSLSSTRCAFAGRGVENSHLFFLHWSLISP